MTIGRTVESLLHRFGQKIPDKTYLELLYKAHMGKSLDLNNPRTMNEKLQWLKLYNRRPEYTRLVDKIEVKDWVREKIGDKYIIPTLKVWNRAEEIDISGLPDGFVLKCNHSGGNTGVFLVDDKSGFNLEAAKRTLAEVLEHSVYTNYREWPYKNVRRRVFAEKLIGKGIDDYKFYCFNGFVDSVMVCSDRQSGDTKFYFFDKDWNLKRYNVRGKNAPVDFTLPKPEGMDVMFEIASELSEGLPFVRVDLYNVDGKIYFGEMTFFPASGLDENRLPETDLYFGNMIKLPVRTNN